MSTEVSVGCGATISGSWSTGGTIGSQVTEVEATLQEVSKQQAFASRPLKVPDLRMFGIGWEVNVSA
jgi:hypothetical protein